MQTTMKSSGNFTLQMTRTARPALRAAPVVRASSDPMLQKPAAPAPPSQPAAAPAAAATMPGTSGVTIEYQRQQAKALQQYFRDLKLEEAVADAQVFGWTKNNEINNGRWVMMGFAIGLLTEYSTGVSFIGQLKLMVSYMGILDLD